MAQGELDPHFSTVDDEMAFPQAEVAQALQMLAPATEADAVCWRRGRYGAGGTGFA